jgi:hypothetical protein
MERRHDEILTARLEDVLLNGCAHITWDELYHWYGVQKIAAGTMRDLKTRWEEVTKGRKTGSLKMVEGRGGMFLHDSHKSKFVDPDRVKAGE